MVITYQGGGSFRIQSGNLSIVVDPQNDRQKPDVLLKTAAPYPAENPGQGEITGPGEYEIAGIGIRGIQIAAESKTDLIKTIYRVLVEDLALGFMGELWNIPDAESIQALGDIDILVLPVGGKPYLKPEDAAKLVKQIEPTVVIPSHYKNPKDFFEEMGQRAAPQEKFTVKKKELVEMGESLKVICFTA